MRPNLLLRIDPTSNLVCVCLCEDKMNLINLDEWGKKKHPPRIGESISEFTALGKVRNNIMFACDVLFDSN